MKAPAVTPPVPARALVVSNNYPPYVMGGYELLCQEYVAWLCGHGCDVAVLTTRFGTGGEDPSFESGMAGERILRALDLDFDWEHVVVSAPTGRNLWRREREERVLLEQLVATLQPDLALVWGMGAVSKSLLGVLHRLSVPIVAVIGEPWPASPLDADPWLSSWTNRWRMPWRVLRLPFAGLASDLVAPTDIHEPLAALTPVYASNHLRDVVEAARAELRGRGIVVPNGIRVERFSRQRDSAEPLSSPVRLLYAGRVEHRKGVHTAVASLADLRRLGVKATLTVAGWKHPDYVDRLRTLATDLKVSDQLDLRDSVPRDQLGELFADHDILVFPALWEEPFGLVPLEAMAGGCVVVATGTGGSGEYLRHRQNAMLFRPGYSLGLAECVLDLSEDPALVAQLRRAGYETATSHSFDDYAARLDAISRRVLAAAPSPS